MAKTFNKGQRLGRGLQAILPTNDVRTATDENAEQVIGNILLLDLDSIDTNPNQPRTIFNEESLQELATSIKEYGVIQPITVRKIGPDKYELISGERRLRASKIAGIEKIPAFIRIANDEESLIMALIENIQRQDLDPIEVALSYNRMIEELNLTQEQMSEKVGKKRSTITNYLRLLKLDPIIQSGIRDGFISMGHGRAIINIDETKEQIDIYNKIIAQDLSVRDTEALVQQITQPEKVAIIKQNKNHQIPDFVKNSVEEIRQRFGANITVKYTKGKGKLEIPFKSEEDFKRIQKILQGE